MTLLIDKSALHERPCKSLMMYHSKQCICPHWRW